jgi:hypothetical protein
MNPDSPVIQLAAQSLWQLKNAKQHFQVFGSGNAE